MSTDVDRIVQSAVAKFQGLSPVAVREIVETTVETVRADLLVKFREFQEGIATATVVPAPAKKAKNGASKKAPSKKAAPKAAAKNGEKKPRKPLSAEARKNLAANLKKARAAKAEKAQKATEANEARSAAMKKRWAKKKKDAKKVAKKSPAKKK